jgi:hypothetical protein
VEREKVGKFLKKFENKLNFGMVTSDGHGQVTMVGTNSGAHSKFEVEVGKTKLNFVFDPGDQQ